MAYGPWCHKELDVLDVRRSIISIIKPQFFNEHL